MKTIARIIRIFGGYEDLHVSIPNEPYMRLCIEHIGAGPRRYPAISVAHYFEQNGDLCADPEMCFELVPEGAHVNYEPYSFQQAIPPLYQEVFANGSENVWLKQQLMSFAQEWDRHLQAQSFESTAARQQAQQTQLEGKE